MDDSHDYGLENDHHSLIDRSKLSCAPISVKQNNENSQYFRLPAPENVKAHLGFFDLGVKLQFVLMELSTGIFWCSIIEIFVYLMTFALFLTAPKTMSPTFCHILHLVRPVIGGLIIWKMPNSEDLITEIREAALATNDRVTPNGLGAFLKTSS